MEVVKISTPRQLAPLAIGCQFNGGGPNFHKLKHEGLKSLLLNKGDPNRTIMEHQEPQVQLSLNKLITIFDILTKLSVDA